ncbi:uncharacterized protein LOC142351209 [Convolutriloba macropyga]|uniref:uncharacterized protein LOC142351209 n=1 Tax=Convolutriloba macropyga TaxID=536237 RepID=UPI003F522F60
MEFLDHLKSTAWLDWKAWFCACCCPSYAFAKISYHKLQEDSYRMCVAGCCPCLFAWWYMKALEKIPESTGTKIMACLWTYCCGTCALYVAAVEDGMDPIDETKKCIEVVKKVVCISRQ